MAMDSKKSRFFASDSDSFKRIAPLENWNWNSFGCLQIYDIYIYTVYNVYIYIYIRDICIYIYRADRERERDPFSTGSWFVHPLLTCWIKC